MNGSASSARMGRYVTTVAYDESVQAFVPATLPPDPPINLSGNLLLKLSDADRAIGRLDGISVMLPEKALFLYMYVRKEAVLSSQIEGAQSTLDDLLRFENVAMLGQPIDDITEVSPTVNSALEALEQLAIVREITGKKRGSVYCYEQYMDILDDGAGARRRKTSRQ